MKVYYKNDYIELAKAVIAGMPQEEANKVLEAQREIKAKGEEHFWLTLNKDGVTTIQLTRKTKSMLETLKKDMETFEDVVLRLIHENKESDTPNL